MKVSFQQMMIGTLCKSEDKTRKTLRKCKELGFDAIELNSFMIHPSGMLVRLLTSLAGMPTGSCGKYDWQSLVKDAGLEVSALQVDLGTLERETERVVSEAKSLETSNVVITGLYRFDYTNEQNMISLCERLNAIGAVLLKEGLSLLYHNHNVEYKRLPSGEFVFDFLFRNTNADVVNFEFDSYWPSESGVDVVNEMKKLGSRLKLHHITDRGSNAKGPFVTPILKSDCRELGCGAMPIAQLLDIDKSNNMEYITLETHRNFVDNNPLKSMEISINYLRQRGYLCK